MISLTLRRAAWAWVLPPAIGFRVLQAEAQAEYVVLATEENDVFERTEIVIAVLVILKIHNFRFSNLRISGNQE